MKRIKISGSSVSCARPGGWLGPAAWALLAALALAFSSTVLQAQVMLLDYGPSPPTPGPTDIAQLNAYWATNPGGLNYYWNNGSPPGQTFTTGGNPGGYTMTSLYIKTAGDGYYYVFPNPFALRIYSVSGNTATLSDHV